MTNDPGFWNRSAPNSDFETGGGAILSEEDGLEGADKLPPRSLVDKTFPFSTSA